VSDKSDESIEWRIFYSKYFRYAKFAIVIMAFIEEKVIVTKERS